MVRRMLTFGALSLQSPHAPASATAHKIEQPSNSAASHKARKIVKPGLLFCVTCTLSLGTFASDLTVPNPKPATRIADVPIRLCQQYLIVAEGQIGNLEHQKFLIDTGTNPSMIDKSVATRLGLQGVPRRVALFNKNVVSEKATLPDLRFGPIHRLNMPVMVADFAQIGREMGTRIDAVIGLDVLGNTSFTVDYVKRRIIFGASVEAHTASFTAAHQFITVNLASGSRQLHLLLDTGRSEERR